MLCIWTLDSKYRCGCVWVAGKTVWSLAITGNLFRDEVHDKALYKYNKSTLLYFDYFHVILCFADTQQAYLRCHSVQMALFLQLHLHISMKKENWLTYQKTLCSFGRSLIKRQSQSEQFDILNSIHILKWCHKTTAISSVCRD